MPISGDTLGMYQRALGDFITSAFKNYPIVTLTGPRQSGKTTLSRHLFPEWTYVSLEDPDIRLLATEDPRGFFSRFNKSLILDEIQRVPELTSYLQSRVDEPNHKNQYLLTGSHQLLLMEAVSQSLAGRTRVLELLPLSHREIDNQDSLKERMFKGGYPRIYEKNLNPTNWLKDYLSLYVEKDLRSLVQVLDLDAFERFIRLCAGRAGQLVNFLSLGNEAGISQPTAQAWFNALKTSYICFTLPAHHKNFNKRIVKTPKLYFYDTGFLCYLLRINQADQIDEHPLRGQIFENYIVSEYLKQSLNLGKESSYYFWRDQKGHEVDLVEDRGTYLYPTEIKLGETFHSNFLRHLEYLNKLQDLGDSPKGRVVYAGSETHSFKGYDIVSWSDI